MAGLPHREVPPLDRYLRTVPAPDIILDRLFAFEGVVDWAYGQGVGKVGLGGWLGE